MSHVARRHRCTALCRCALCVADEEDSHDRVTALQSSVARLVASEVASILEAAEDFVSAQQHVEAMRSYSLALDAVGCLTAVSTPVGGEPATAGPAVEIAALAGAPVLPLGASAGDARVPSVAALYVLRSSTLLAAGNVDMAVQVRWRQQ